MGFLSWFDRLWVFDLEDPALWDGVQCQSGAVFERGISLRCVTFFMRYVYGF